jgi:SAM-dependent methyltransferase
MSIWRTTPAGARTTFAGERSRNPAERLADGIARPAPCGYFQGSAVIETSDTRERNEKRPEDPQSEEKRPGLRERMRRAWRRLRGGELTPSRAFWSVALGLFIGVQPTPGLHLPTVLAIYVPLRLDAALGYLASNVSIPPIAPFLWFASLQLGARIVTGSFVPLTPEGAREIVHAPGPLLGSLVVGSVALGAAIGIAGGSLAYLVARARTTTADDRFEPAIARAARRFKRAAKSRGTYYFVRSKLRRDPAARMLDELRPLGEVLDLGCGRGQLAVLLLEAGSAARVRGIDWDAPKIALASHAADGLNASFETADVRSRDLGAADTVLLVDVLHYLPRAEQDALVARAASCVKPGGRLVVREACSGKGLRSTITSAVEWISIKVRFNRGVREPFRDVEREMVPLLEKRGFVCAVRPCWQGTPFSNVLLVATRAHSEVEASAAGAGAFGAGPGAGGAVTAGGESADGGASSGNPESKGEPEQASKPVSASSEAAARREDAPRIEVGSKVRMATMLRRALATRETNRA